MKQKHDICFKFLFIPYIILLNKTLGGCLKDMIYRFFCTFISFFWCHVVVNLFNAKIMVGGVIYTENWLLVTCFKNSNVL